MNYNVFNVYLPCDTNNENDSYDYNEVLLINSQYCCNNHVIHRIIAGDLNTYFTRLGSNNTISLIDTIGIKKREMATENEIDTTQE